MKSFAVISLLLCIPFILAYNISPIPNFIKNVSSAGNNSRSPYFGFSITLRKSHILISAPRANSTLYSQREILEPGMIYKCKFNNEACEEYYMDRSGDSEKNKNYLNNEKKEYRLLGFSMDGGENDNDPFVACAPKSLTPHRVDELKFADYHMFGVCYWKPDTIDQLELKVTKVAPLRDYDLITKQSENKPFYRYGESGFSVHILNKKEILLGAPGVYNWMGTAINYNIQKSKQSKTYYQGIVADKSGIDFNSYFGYSITSGQFLLPNYKNTFYISSAPRLNDGRVMIFGIDEIDQRMIIYHQFYGTQYSSYFGYSIICEDFNGDEKPDIVVSAPFLSKKNSEETGGIFVYMNDCNNDCAYAEV